MNPLANIFGKSPMGLIMDTLKTGGNPKELAERMMQKYGANNPMLSELTKLANNNDKQGIENLARSYFEKQGRNFDSEYSEFLKQFKM